MSVGFTGTQQGMSPTQKQVIRQLLVNLKPSVVHHGDCIGSDAEFHDICLDLNIPIEIHPPLQRSKRTFCKGAVIIHPPKEYLPRDVDIVLSSKILIATPKSTLEEIRSGTWYTVRQARKYDRDIYIIFPNGVIQPE